MNKMIIHPVLKRQLKRLGLNEDQVPSLEQWREIIKRINQSYQENDSGQYLNEQAAKISSREMAEKNKILLAAIAELKNAQEQIIQSEKMSILSQIAAGLAHEINNPLSFVISNINVLNKRLKLIFELIELYQQLSNGVAANQLVEFEEHCKKIIFFSEKNKIQEIMADIANIMAESNEGLNRVKSIIASLGVYLKGDSNTKGPVNINHCVRSAEIIVQDIFSPKIEFINQLAELPTLLGSISQLTLVFSNLFTNAAEAIQEKGEITVISKVIDADIVVTVTDNGVGISPENVSKIFMPFFTTKALGSAIGLGLMTAYAIIQIHGGNLTVESQLGSGSTFTVRLPLNP